MHGIGPQHVVAASKAFGFTDPIPADPRSAKLRHAMTTISTKCGLVTLINVFTVEPANQRRLVELLREATEVSVRQAPGFVSATLHRSTDGTKVTMYAQWRSIDDYQAMRQDPAPLPFFQEALTIAKFEPGIYEVVQTYTPAGETAGNLSRQ
jgi:quinol monooxygenase YgiN